MNFWELLQILGSAGIALALIEVRERLRKRDNFTEKWNFVSSAGIGICMGAVTDAVITPDRIATFGLTALFVTIIYMSYGRRTLQINEVTRGEIKE